MSNSLSFFNLNMWLRATTCLLCYHIDFGSCCKYVPFSSCNGFHTPYCQEHLSGCFSISYYWTFILYFFALWRFRNELPDPTAQPKLLSLKRDKDRYAILSWDLFVAAGWSTNLRIHVLKYTSATTFMLSHVYGHLMQRISKNQWRVSWCMHVVVIIFFSVL